jgi:excisionase family DNA binding protein
MVDQENWLTLSEAAQRLGVHVNTLRRWTEQGRVPFITTLGGHRRFAATDIETLLMQQQGREQAGVGDLWAQRALVLTRQEIVTHSDQAWLAGFDSQHRLEKRALGQRLMGLILQFVSQDGSEDAILAEARSIGTAYAQNALMVQMPLSTVLSAIIFFRGMMTTTALDLPDTINLRPQDQKRLLGRITGLLNEVEMAIVKAYEDTRN